jgi:hypothetical protein
VAQRHALPGGDDDHLRKIDAGVTAGLIESCIERVLLKHRLLASDPGELGPELRLGRSQCA